MIISDISSKKDLLAKTRVEQLTGAHRTNVILTAANYNPIASHGSGAVTASLEIHWRSGRKSRGHWVEDLDRLTT
ncbi:unnamed protein product [Dibothriocephalus latus]|uniref:Uncharacterized protein n=1 Tax=Dibothriocephalus latus TaxID=60516 RepID=A0A3P7NZZ3_DIBLA|nr:unnamed protein product [Dibothriocephalus latus]